MENKSTTVTREVLLKDVGHFKKDATQIVDDVKEHAQAHVDEAKQRVQAAVSNAQATLARHPFAILGVGLFLGYVFGARSRRKRA